jgi:hypothetical protein
MNTSTMSQLIYDIMDTEIQIMATLWKYVIRSWAEICLRQGSVQQRDCGERAKSMDS